MVRRRDKVEVTMFPFLSVLCSVIGVLVLFIVLILSTRVVVEDQRYRRTDAYERVPSPGRPDVVQQGIDPTSYAALEAELLTLSQHLAQRNTEREALVRKLASLEDLLEFKRTELLVQITAPPRREFNEREKVAMLAMVPNDEFDVKLKPILIEVSASGYTIQPAGTSFGPIERGEPNQRGPNWIIEPALKSFLQGVNARRRREYLVFLVHPNGVSTFQTIRNYVTDRHKDVRIGWEPFSRQWVVANKAQ